MISSLCCNFENDRTKTKIMQEVKLNETKIMQEIKLNETKIIFEILNKN